MNVTLKRGKWYAGIDTPFMASDGVIKAKLKGYGFTDVEIFDREDKALPAGVKPSSDTWDKWGTATYAGEPKTVELHEAVTWVIEPKPLAWPKRDPAPTSTPTPKKAKGLSTNQALALAALAWWFL